MALLFVDGFDHYTTAEITKKWSGAVNATIAATSGRRGGGAYLSSWMSYISKTLPSTYSTLIVGAAFYSTHSGTQNVSIIELREGATTHFTLSLDTTVRKLKIYRGTTSGTLLATSNTSLNASVWYHIEMKVVINDTTGAATIKINGVTDSGLTLTNTDTRNGGTTGLIDTIYITGGTQVSGQTYLDDFYVCDTSGSTNNDFLGDCRIDTLYPDGAGNYTEFTSSNGANYTAVNKTTPANTPYVYSSNSGFRDSYSFSNLVSTGSDNVYAVQVNAYITKDDAGTREASTIARANSVDANGVSTGLSTSSFAFLSQVYETDPSANNWTQTSVNSAEFGVRVSV